MNRPYSEISPGFYAADSFAPLLKEMKLDSIDAVFAFQGGDALNKANLAGWRHRMRFELPDGRFAYLKRYDNAPASIQLKAWIQHAHRAFLSEYDQGPKELAAASISTPETIAFGGQRGVLLETRSFIISLEIQGQSLENKLPDCFSNPRELTGKKEFTRKAADFIRRFHNTGFRHRDLYLCHIFLSGHELLLIDLHRCFKPRVLADRYAIKDLAQLHYSCPADSITRTDRMRFFHEYLETNRLSGPDKHMVRQIHRKALQMAAHDRKHGRTVPFLTSKKESEPC